MPSHIVIAGGSGFLGRHLSAALLRDGTHVRILTRGDAHHNNGIEFVPWDGRTEGDWTRSLDGAAGLVNLTGKSVNCRYTRANREEIVRSRVDSVNVLHAALAQCRQPPPVWVQAGSLAIYGDAGDRVCDESAPHGSGFSVDVCRAWEEAFDRVDHPGLRRVTLRIGFVLAADGGALDTLARLARWGLGGTVGSGRQYISWLHIADMMAMFRLSLSDSDVAGVYNATGPTPVTNRVFMGELRRVLHRPWSPPAPAPAVRVGSWLMGTDASLALTGRRCLPRRWEQQDFAFSHTGLTAALEDLLDS